jgi:hypothetical protein
MARFRHVTTGVPHYLDPESLLGRAQASTLVCDAPSVSLHHAAVRWGASGRWEIEDLNSRNGTFLNGQRLRPGAVTPLRPGATVALGTLDNGFEFDDASRPTVMLAPLRGGEPIWLLREKILALPSAESPTYTLFSHPNGAWLLEGPNETRPLQHGDIVVIQQMRWRFSSPRDVSPTVTAPASTRLGYVRDLRIILKVSADEERVHLSLVSDEHTHDLGCKACHYLLLTLARCRLGQGLPEATRVDPLGWIEVGELGEMLRMSEQRLNVDVFRLRRMFADLGVLDANNIIERRSHPRSVRLGTPLATIQAV